MKREPEIKHNKISMPLSKKKLIREWRQDGNIWHHFLYPYIPYLQPPGGRISIEDPTFGSFTFFEPFVLFKQKTWLENLF